MNTLTSKKHSYSLTLLVTLVLVACILVLANVRQGWASEDDASSIYFPLLRSNARQAAVPQLSTSIRLEGSRCPNDMAYNPYSANLYIANEESDNVTVISNGRFAGNIATGNWPVQVASDPHSEKVYLSHVLDGIRVIEGSEITANIRAYSEPYTILINPVNGYTYITDLHRPINIIQGYEKVMNLFVPDFQGNVIGWQLAADYDRQTGLAYFASWQYQAVTVVDGLSVVDQFSFAGEGASDMIVDEHRRVIVVTNDRAFDDKASPNNISIIDMDTKQVTSIFSADYSYRVALDPATGYMYVTNPANNSVTVLLGTEEIATYQTGEKPREVAVDSVRGLAYVTNAGDNSISVFRDGVPIAAINLPPDKGFKPWDVTVDETSGRVYILNRSTVEKHGDRDSDRVECRQPWLHILE